MELLESVETTKADEYTKNFQDGDVIEFKDVTIVTPACVHLHFCLPYIANVIFACEYMRAQHTASETCGEPELSVGTGFFYLTHRAQRECTKRLVRLPWSLTVCILTGCWKIVHIPMHGWIVEHTTRYYHQARRQ